MKRKTRERTSIFKRYCCSPPRLLLFMFMLLWGAVSNQSFARDLYIENIATRWDQATGSFRFSGVVVEGNDYDEAFKTIDINLNGYYVATVNASYSDNYYRYWVTNKYENQEVYAGGQPVPLNSTVTINSDQLDLAIFPNYAGWINNHVSVTCNWVVDVNVLDDAEGYGYTMWSGNTSTYGFAPTMSNWALHKDDAMVHYSITSNDLTSANSAESYIDVRYAFTEYGTYHNYTQQPEVLTKNTPTKDYANYLLDYAVTDQQFADGLWFLLSSTTKVDAWSKYITPAQYTQSYHTGYTAVIKDGSFTVEQNNRDIILNWSVLQPTGNPQSQDMADFGIEIFKDGVWQEIDVVDYSLNKTDYSYTYTLGDDECNKGDINYKFRVWKKRFVNRLHYAHRMATDEKETIIHTNYKTVKITSISPVDDRTEANVQWSLNGDGIWDDAVKVTLRINNETTGSGATDIEVPYQATEYKVGGLQGCTSYNFSLLVEVMGSLYHTSEVENLIMSDLGSRDIVNLEVSKGYYSNYVRVSWEVPSDQSDFTHFDILRRNLDTDETVSVTQITHSGLTQYSYQDNSMDVGIMYEYKVIGYSECNNKPAIGATVSSIGFTQPYATVSGRISYNSSQGVPEVSVAVVGADEASANKSIYFTGVDTSSNLNLPGTLFDYTKSDNYTLQMWINPSLQTQNSSAQYNCPYMFSKAATFDMLINSNSDFTIANELTFYFLGGSFNPYYRLPADKWTHLTIVTSLDAQHTTGTLKLYIDGVFYDEYKVDNLNVEALNANHLSSFKLGRVSDSALGYKGYIDELRVFNSALSEMTIAQNYNMFLSGKEANLMAYYRFDEKGSDEVFDLSAVGSKFNKNDGVKGTMASHSSYIPSAEQLSIKGFTDEDGNFLINTIPYTNDGLQYNIVPTLGIHKFSPNKQPIFVSPSAKVFNNINFDDKSSFPVSGVVYYEGTDYPVEGASLYVDGIICSYEGKTITTDSQGRFEISVPIGDHHITIEKQGHTFVNNGRFPADAEEVGVKHTFNQEISNLTFYDNTLVTIAGRVVGGEIESDKPLGFGLSKNNIGKATLKLSAGAYRLNVTKEVSGTTVSYIDNPNDVAVSSPSKLVASKAYRAGANAGDVKYIYITTDSITGEFAALVPPLTYTIEDVDVLNNDKISFGKNLSAIDASNPSLEFSDSTTINDNQQLSFKYNTSTILTYRSSPSFTVADMSNNSGAYGERTYEYSDLTTEKEEVEIYQVDDESAVVDYKFGHPIFVKGNRYNFKLKGYEEYSNYDNDVNAPITDQVPLDGTIVTITNEMSATQSVYVESGEVGGTSVEQGDFVELQANQLELDSLGQATYSWEAGFPNITAPYTRKLSVVYNNNGKQVDWEGNDTFNAIVLGNLPSGNNFITSGPDKVLMILRDPAGSNSSAFWEAGTTVTTETSGGASFISNTDFTTKTDLGSKVTTIVGTPGAGVINTVEVTNTLDVGVRLNIDYTDSKTTTTSVTTTKQISTSDSPDYLGRNGDVFIGAATNILFGNARNVTLVKDAKNGYGIGNEDIVTMGSEYATGFNYSQNYIEEVLIPNLHTARNALIQTVANVNGIAPAASGLIYVSTLSPDDERFGSKNTDKELWGSQANTDASLLSGPSYTIIKPTTIAKDEVLQDMVLWYNKQIEMWIKTLAENEEVKVKAIKESSTYLAENISFDQGATINSSISTSKGEATTKEWTTESLIVAGFDLGACINQTGVQFALTEEIGARNFGSSTSSTENVSTTGFTLCDDGHNDALSVDVYNAPDGFGAVFATRGGQTSCPYEGAVYTKYYKPGTEISAATMQVEVPVIEAENYFVTDVPVGSPASFNIELRNDSETGDDAWFELKVVDATNANGASISMDGSKLSEEGRSLLVPAGSSLKKIIQLSQTEIDVLDYNDIAIVLASQCQNDPTGLFPVIADTIYIGAQYVPSCSNITLKIDEPTINMFTSDVLKVEMTDFDRSFNSFKSIRLQYKYANDVNWTTGKEYVLDATDVTTGKELLPDGGIIKVDFPMSNDALFPDGVYQFRLQTTCIFGAEGVYNESETVTVTKDMVSPEALGKPNPADGILNAGEDISLRFNEDIRSGALTDANNYMVTGALNDARIDHNVALRLDGTDSAAAKTEASVLLTGNSFTMDMWLNYNSGEGSLIEHGTGDNKFIVAINAEGKLAVTVGDECVTSQQTIPIDTWCFLTVCYMIGEDSNNIFATLATDASTIKLIEGNAVPAYEGAGVLTVGKGLKGAMHEVSLWNRARTSAEAITDMYQGKPAFTSNLIGYWKLSEGNGNVALDAVRNRHMVLDNATWDMNDTNIAAKLGADAHIDMSIATTSADNDDNYLVEMWFKGAAQTNATLWSANDIAMKFNNDGLLALVSDGEETVLSTTNYLDNTWHHIAMNVLRTGSAIVYVDGETVKQLTQADVAPLRGVKLVVGATVDGSTYSDHFTGEVDEIRYWKVTVNGNYIASNRFNRIDTDKVAGLMAYYPFEATGLDEYNQVVTSFSLADASDNAVGEATAIATTVGANAPGLKAAPTVTNIQFNTVASERDIVFNLTDEPYRLEGTTVNFTVRNVCDINNNINQPIMWSAYINRNCLKWDKNEVSLKQQNGEASEFTVLVENLSGEDESWLLSDLPKWLNVSETQGNLSPLASRKLTFIVSNATPIGKYEEVIYLSGNDLINVPLVVSLTVLGEMPEWSVNPADFESSMNVIGQLSILGKVSYDEDDIVAAFNDNICVGMASPQYFSNFDSYYVMMDIYGQSDVSNTADIQFKVWDASTGTIYPAVTSTPAQILYSADNLLGAFNEPVSWNAENYIEQSISLTKGWNWISLGINPKDKSLGSVLNTIDENASLVKGKLNYSEQNSGTWVGTMNEIASGSMYKVAMNDIDKLLVTGSVLTDNSVAINAETGWTWIGYSPQFSLTVNDALADFDAQDGDIIKGQVGFATYQDYQWLGSLNTLESGKGYMLENGSDSDKSFIYPATSPYINSTKSMLTLGSTAKISVSSFAENEVYQGKYPNNMTMTAAVMYGDEVLDGVDVGVFVNDECRESYVVGTHYAQRAFLTIAGEENGEPIVFKVVYNNETYTIDQNIDYFTDAIVGKYDSPYIIQLKNDLTGLRDAKSDTISIYPNPVDDLLNIDTQLEFSSVKLFNASGSLMFEASENVDKIDMTKCAAGVYFITLTDMNGNVYNHRVIKQ